MSKTSATSPWHDYLRTVIPLLKEYGSKLDAIRQQLTRLREKHSEQPGDENRNHFLRMEYEVYRSAFQRLRPAALKLAQHVSQRVEHSGLEDVDRLELRLRLAEFESALEAADRAVALYTF